MEDGLVGTGSWSSERGSLGHGLCGEALAGLCGPSSHCGAELVGMIEASREAEFASPLPAYSRRLVSRGVSIISLPFLYF